MKPKLPEKDLKDINDSFKEDTGRDTFVKNANGERLKAVNKVSNKKTVKLNYFYEKVLKHQKSVATKDGQIIVGIKGQKYENISPKLRKLVSWNESDFI